MMNGAPPAMQFANLQYAQSPDLGAQLQSLGKNLKPAIGAVKGMLPTGGPLPGEAGADQAGPVAPGGAMPLPGMPGSAAAGPVAPAAAGAQPGLMDALKGLSPQQILDRLRMMSAAGQQVTPPGMPGSAALAGAGLLPSGGWGG